MLEDKREFFGSTFIDKEHLELNNIQYQIRLEYYKIKNENNEYGVEVVKTEYRDEFEKVENASAIKITKEENIIEKVIDKLKENLVTPMHLDDIVKEMIV